MSKKISQFLASTTLPDDAVLTFVSGGTNYKISLDDFEAALGLNGYRPAGLVYMSTGATTDITTADTPVKLAGTFTAQTQVQFSASSTGRLTYTGSVTRSLSVMAVIDVHSASGSDDIGILIAKNGTSITGTRMVVKGHGSADSVSICTTWIVEFATNDYVEIFVENASDTSDIVGTHAILRAG